MSKKEQVRAMFDKIAPRYDLLNKVLSFGVDISWRRKLVRMVAGGDPRSILDVATGTGDVAIMAARSNPRATVTGIDLSANMLAIARERVARKDIGNITAMIEGEAENMPFADGSFDAVTVVFGVRNFADLRAGVGEMYRVLRPGGRVYVLEFSMPRGRLFGRLYTFYFRRFLPWIGGVVSGEKSAYRYLQSSVESFEYGDRFAAILSDAGFTDVTQKSLTGGVAIIYTGVVSG